MKVFAGLVAAAHALTAADCPNDAWELNSASDACVPKSSEITVTCSATGMNVVFSEKLLYVSLDSTHSGTADSSANTLTDDCTAAVSSGSEYNIDIPLDGCSTTVTQDTSAGTITFSNTLVGNTAAVTVDGIITTERLELDVQCVFDDNFSLTVDDIGIEAADHEIAGSDSTGDFETVFTLASYTDAGFTTLSSSTNAVTIGKSVYNRVSVSSLPSNVDFYVTDCTAQDAASSATATYMIVKDGCMDNLLAANAITDDLVGDASTNVDFSFNGFTFASTSDIVYLSCDITLCAVDANGDKIESDCGPDLIDGSCTDTSKTLGYTSS